MLRELVTEVRGIVGLAEAGPPPKKNPKHAALVKKLKKIPGVRDAEALAAWIGHRVGGSRSHSKEK